MDGAMKRCLSSSGKTTFAKALAQEADCNFVILSCNGRQNDRRQQPYYNVHKIQAAGEMTKYLFPVFAGNREHLFSKMYLSGFGKGNGILVYKE